jgi:hypothetical protein
MLVLIMKRTRTLFSGCVALVVTAIVLVPLPGAAVAKVRFTSVYTDFVKQCTYTDEAELEEGQDASATCPGPGGYKIVSSPYAIAETLIAVKGEVQINLADVPFGYLDTKGRKLEWRLANGVAFAAILRVDTYRASDDGNPFAENLKTGSVIKVVGLIGHERITGLVNTKAKSANEKARALADRQYR